LKKIYNILFIKASKNYKNYPDIESFFKNLTSWDFTIPYFYFNNRGNGDFISTNFEFFLPFILEDKISTINSEESYSTNLEEIYNTLPLKDFDDLSKVNSKPIIQIENETLPSEKSFSHAVIRQYPTIGDIVIPKLDNNMVQNFETSKTTLNNKSNLNKNKNQVFGIKELFGYPNLIPNNILLNEKNSFKIIQEKYLKIQNEIMSNIDIEINMISLEEKGTNIVGNENKYTQLQENDDIKKITSDFLNEIEVYFKLLEEWKINDLEYSLLTKNVYQNIEAKSSVTLFNSYGKEMKVEIPITQINFSEPSIM
jgi:hypothetical protein